MRHGATCWTSAAGAASGTGRLSTARLLVEFGPDAKSDVMHAQVGDRAKRDDLQF
jgi:hypothetical protein